MKKNVQLELLVTNQTMMNFFIQFSIFHEEKEYIITNISEGVFKCCEHIKSIQFTTN